MEEIKKMCDFIQKEFDRLMEELTLVIDELKLEILLNGEESEKAIYLRGKSAVLMDECTQYLEYKRELLR